MYVDDDLDGDGQLPRRQLSGGYRRHDLFAEVDCVENDLYSGKFCDKNGGSSSILHTGIGVRICRAGRAD
jgi:hypothetical protein